MPEAPRIILHNAETARLAKMLLEAFPDAQYRVCNSYQALPALIESFCPQVVYTVRFAGTQGFPSAALFGPQGPKWISNGGAGTDHFGTWDARKKTVTNAAGVAASMMAEYIFGGFLHFTLDVPGLQQDKVTRDWRARNVLPLSGKTILVLGLGNTGRAVAKLAQAFGMTVLGTRARPEKMPDVDEIGGPGDLPDLLPRADFIAVSTPLIPATRGLIGAKEIARMKPGVILADVSRGGVVDQSALHEALKSRHVAAAALDVFETEPLPQESPLWALDNVIISPHCSSVFSEWEEASFQLFLENLGRWVRGETLRNVVDPLKGY